MIIKNSIAITLLFYATSSAASINIDLLYVEENHNGVKDEEQITVIVRDANKKALTAAKLTADKCGNNHAIFALGNIKLSLQEDAVGYYFEVDNQIVGDIVLPNEINKGSLIVIDHRVPETESLFKIIRSKEYFLRIVNKENNENIMHCNEEYIEKGKIFLELKTEKQQLKEERIGHYIEIIKQKITRNWFKPADAKDGLSSTVKVRIIPGGEVLDVRVVKSSGDPVFDRSVQAAVLKSSPFPLPPDDSLFERFRILQFVFHSEE